MTGYDDFMARSYVFVKARMRYVRWLILASMVIGVAYLANRFVIVRLEMNSSDCEPHFPPGSSLLVDSWNKAEHQEGAWVAYQYPGEEHGRVGRVLAIGGNQIEVRRASATERPELHVDGRPTRVYLRQRDDPDVCQQTIPPGHVFFVNLNLGARAPDSRSFGTRPASQLVGRVMVRLPF